MLSTFITTTVVLENQEHGDSPEWLKVFQEPHDLMTLLYDLEVIGIERVVGSSGNSRKQWENFDFSYHRSKGKVENSNSFLFHPGLWKSLELL